MTKRAFKLILTAQTKGVYWFISIYALVMAILLTVFSFLSIDDTSWIPLSIVYAPKIYLLVMGIVYPLLATKLYVSCGLTRKQFFWAYTGAISAISLFLLIPILATVIYYDGISLPSAITHYLQMPLFFLIGWTSVVGFQIRRKYISILSILCAIIMFHSITTMPEILALSEISELGVALLLLTGLLLILPRIISKVQFTN